MDEKNIDNRLQDRFKNYEDPVYDEENWDKLSRILQNVSHAPKAPLFPTSRLLKVGGILLLLSNLILLFVVLNQNSQIEELLIVQENIHNERLVDQEGILLESKADTSIQQLFTDTIAYKANSARSHSTQSNLAKEAYPSNIQLGKDNTQLNIEQEEKSPRVRSQELILPINRVNEVQKQEEKNWISQHIIRALQPLTLLELELLKSLNCCSGVFEQIPLALGNKSKNQDTNLEKKQGDRIFKPGIFIGLPRIKTDISEVEPGIDFGLDLEVAVNDQLNLYTGVSYTLISYKIDDHGRPEELNELLLTYPAISEDQSINNLHEIFLDAQVLSFPLGLRYDLHVLENMHPFIEGGIYGRLFLKQIFEYEYSISEARFIRETEILKKKLDFGGAYVSIGSRFRVNKFSAGEISLFYNKDLIPQGAEGRIYSLWGIKGAIRLNPQK